ncbi:MAG: PPOX class F420-dependent oxidoreductase [Dehalococcoidia bacterium]
MATIPESHAALVGAPHFAHLATINKDGSPQTSPVWVQRDGDDVLFTTDMNYRKGRNMRRDARVALSIHDANNPYRYIELLGRVEIRPRENYDFLDGLAKQYMGVDEYPYKRAEAEGVLVRVKVEQASVMEYPNAPKSRPLPEGESDLVGAPHFAHVATMGADGAPRSTPVWIKREGDDALFWTGERTTKVRNLRRNPVIALSIHDETNPYRYVELRGTAELTRVSHADLLDDLARQYWEVDEYPDKSPGMEGVEVRAKVEHVVRFG